MDSNIDYNSKDLKVSYLQSQSSYLIVFNIEA